MIRNTSEKNTKLSDILVPKGFVKAYHKNNQLVAIKDAFTIYSWILQNDTINEVQYTQFGNSGSSRNEAKYSLSELIDVASNFNGVIEVDL
jgi:hypothetical protein